MAACRRVRRSPGLSTTPAEQEPADLIMSSPSPSMAVTTSTRRSMRAALFFPYARLRGHRYTHYRDEYEGEARSTHADAVRNRRLRQLIDHARREVAYYRDLSIAPQPDVLDELGRFPILD